MIESQRSLAEQAAFYRQLAVLVGAGTPLPEAITTLSDDCGHGGLRAALAGASEELAQQVPLVEVLARRPRYFTPAISTLLEGQADPGAITDLLRAQADALDLRAELRARLVQGLFFPTLTLLVCGLILSFMLIWVLPVFSTMFADFNAALPAPTQLVLDLGRHTGALLVLLLLALAALLWLVFGHPQLLVDVGARLPLTATLVRQHSVARFVRLLGPLRSAGLGAAAAARAAADGVGARSYAKRFEALAAGSDDWGQLRQRMRESRLFPAMLVGLLGLEAAPAATLSAFNDAATCLERELQRSLLRLLAVFDVTVVLALGLVVGFIVISVYLPIFSIAGAVGA